MKVLVAEDDALIRRAITEVLQDEGYDVLETADGESALEAFRMEQPDFLCLDIMMPAVNGFDVCRLIRGEDPEVPIIFISAKSEEIDKVVGLELGADDFIMKPFGVKELVARIRAVTRRCRRRHAQSEPCSFLMGDLEVFPAELRARREQTTIELSLRDVKLLDLFYRHRGEVLDRTTLMNHAWGEDYFPNSRTLDQHISRLRKRIEAVPEQPRIIQTVHGAGYRFDG